PELGPGPGRVRRHHHVRRQPARQDPDHAARHLRRLRARPGDRRRLEPRARRGLHHGAGRAPRPLVLRLSLDADLQLELGTLSLSVIIAAQPGETVVLLGPNGAGKTTVLGALAGLYAIGRGHITLDGTDLDDPTRNIWVPPERRPIGVVFQDNLLFPHLSALDNVAFALRSRRARRSSARREASAWLERLGLADRVSARPSQRSGGQAQRVALARALAPSPRLLLLDEPLAALDATTRITVRRDLRHHLDQFAGPRILVTHDPID